MIDLLTIVLVLAGAVFFLAGTLGLLRLPDLFTRLHALTKADSLGLGLVVLGLALQAPSVLAAAKLLVVWMVAMISAATIAQLIAVHGRRRATRREDWE